MGSTNTLRWDGRRGHYEVYYVTLTDPATGIGVWIRFSVLAPLSGAPSCALWFVTMEPGDGITARKATFPFAELSAGTNPFRVQIGAATLDDGGTEGAFEDVSWSLRWDAGRPYEHVQPLLRLLASTILELPHGDSMVSGRIGFAGRTVQISSARGAQAHLWGTKHAAAWAWARCGDFQDRSGESVPDTFVDGVSARVERFGRQLGPATPVVARIGGEDFRSVSPLRVLSNRSSFGVGRWLFEAVADRRKLIGEVDAQPSLMAGVTYHDPDGQPAYCYNTETASMRLHVYERATPGPGWAYSSTLLSSGRAHFEYGQRQPVPELELLLQ